MRLQGTYEEAVVTILASVHFNSIANLRPELEPGTAILTRSAVTASVTAKIWQHWNVKGEGIAKAPCHQDIWEGVGIEATRRWLVSFTLRPLYPSGMSRRHPLDRRVGGAQRKFPAPAGNKLSAVQPVAYYRAAITTWKTTKLIWLQFLWPDGRAWALQTRGLFSANKTTQHRYETGR
jgi:hypothetical protein